MKKLITLLLLIGGVFAQEPASNWGEQFEWGSTFESTDSLNLSNAITTINGTDVLYTDALPIEENTEGIYSVWAKWDSVDAADTQIDLDVRLGALMVRGNYVTDAVVEWGDWHTIFSSVKTDTLYIISITTSDSSWWVPANIRQYRTFSDDSDTDTSTVRTTDFLR